MARPTITGVIENAGEIAPRRAAERILRMDAWRRARCRRGCRRSAPSGGRARTRCRPCTLLLPVPRRPMHLPVVDELHLGGAHEEIAELAAALAVVAGGGEEHPRGVVRAAEEMPLCRSAGSRRRPSCRCRTAPAPRRRALPDSRPRFRSAPPPGRWRAPRTAPRPRNRPRRSSAQPRASSRVIVANTAEIAARAPPKRAGCRTRNRPERWKSAMVSSGTRRSRSVFAERCGQHRHQRAGALQHGGLAVSALTRLRWCVASCSPHCPRRARNFSSVGDSSFSRAGRGASPSNSARLLEPDALRRQAPDFAAQLAL